MNEKENLENTATLSKKILNIPFYNKSLQEKSAILILPGQQDYRIPEGIKLWPEKAKYLLVAGTRGDPTYTREDIEGIIKKQKGNQINLKDVKTQGWADHTLGQMQWAVQFLKNQQKINHLIITTAAYHLPRCVLTFFQTMKNQGLEKVIISPVPIYHPSGPNLGIKDEKFLGEMERISAYQKKGNVASIDSWTKYLIWRNQIINHD